MKCKYHYGEYMYILKVFKFVVRDCKRFTVKRALLHYKSVHNPKFRRIYVS